MTDRTIQPDRLISRLIQWINAREHHTYLIIAGKHEDKKFSVDIIIEGMSPHELMAVASDLLNIASRGMLGETEPCMECLPKVNRAITALGLRMPYDA